MKKLFVASEGQKGADTEDLIGNVVPQCMTRSPEAAQIIAFSGYKDMWKMWEHFPHKTLIIYRMGPEVPGADPELPANGRYVYGFEALLELCGVEVAVTA